MTTPDSASSKKTDALSLYDFADGVLKYRVKPWRSRHVFYCRTRYGQSRWHGYCGAGLSDLHLYTGVCAGAVSGRVVTRPFWLQTGAGQRSLYRSLFVFLVGFSTSFENVWVTRIMIFGFIFMMGLIEAPTLPANSRFLAARFPARERGKASGFTTAAQYFALVVFYP